MTNWPIKLDTVYGCWLWQRELDRDGYGLSRRGRSARRAHVAVYEERVGVLPSGIELDHDCRRRCCVNPDHLSPVTRSVNEQRKAWRNRVARKACKRGHDLKLHAIVTPEGGRVCRACVRGVA